MEIRKISKSLVQGLPEVKRRGLSRRSVLSFAGAFGQLRRLEFLERPAR